MNQCAHIIVQGVVQGVGFRYYVSEQAVALGLCGYARNLATGEVEIEVVGSRSLIERLIPFMQKGPRFAEVEHLRIEWKPTSKEYNTFEIY